jgi:hypothetical protein
MYSFKQFNIKAPAKGFEGDKIKMERILNREIVVHAYKIETSKVKTYQERGSDKCLHLQISLNGQKYVLFTGSGCLIEQIAQVPESNFPFTTTIVKDNQRVMFT